MSMRGVSIHALLAECDRLADQPVDRPGRFNPRTPCGVRLGTTIGLAHACEFQSTHSLRSATSHLPPLPCIEPFQSTHSLRSATTVFFRAVARTAVSIHALLAECDSSIDDATLFLPGFNPRTPCGVRRYFVKAINSSAGFQSTHSLRSATGFLGIRGCRGLFQSTHSLRSATIRVKYEDCPHIVSIHALLAECDGMAGSRPRHRRVSIHALLAECDPTPSSWPGTRDGFNPRTPCGVRQHTGPHPRKSPGFQSTHSLRSATVL